MDTLHIESPLTAAQVEKLVSGTGVLISGIIYVARDAAHRCLVEAMDRGEPLPFDIRGQTVYYMGPSPAPPGHVIGAAGPTTSARMDAFTPRLLAAGLRAMIGKGGRSPQVIEAIKKYRAVYFVALGGAGALLAKAVKKAEPVAYAELGAEAIVRLTVVDFPAIVANDMYGNDVFAQGKARYHKE